MWAAYGDCSEGEVMKILIADDDSNLRKLLMNELSGGGLDLTSADSGSAAFDFLKSGDYDVLVLDLNMPDMGGIELLKTMKNLDIATEVIVLTGHATVATAVEAMKLGAYDYLTKPFSMEELMLRVERLLKAEKRTV